MVDFKRALAAKREIAAKDQAKGWNETVQELVEGVRITDPAGGQGNPTITAAPALPISEIPEEWKDGRKVLVFGEYRMNADGYEVTDFAKWWGARYDISDEIWLPLDPAAKSRYWINATHYLPYPADPV